MDPEINEFTIPVAWGHIAVKAWGSKENFPVLCIHGVEDNAGSFDGLIKLLPKSFYYVCVDLPSHGKSSSFPPHQMIKMFDFVISIKMIVDYFKWEKFTFMCHGIGSRAGVVFATLYPQLIDKYINIDAITLFHVDPAFFHKYYLNKINKYFKIEQETSNGQNIEYTYDEALEKLRQSRVRPLEDSAAKAILERKLMPLENGKYLLSNDARVKNLYLEPLSLLYFRDIIKRQHFKFPHLIILVRGRAKVNLFTQMNPILTELKKNKNCHIVKVQGDHDIHKNKPETVAPIISQFLLGNKSKL